MNRRGRSRLLAGGVAVLAPFCATSVAHARAVTLVFDAVYRHAKVVDTTPVGDSVGDRQVVSGVLTDATGRRVGTFNFSCTYVKIVAGDAHERCTGAGASGDGAIRFSGPAVKSDVDHSWVFTGTSGALKGVHGRGLIHDPTTHDSIVVMEFSLARPVRFRDGVAPRSAANRTFVRQATRACILAGEAFRRGAPFPLASFDPLHPTAGQLAVVGRYFSGPGDARPIEHRLLGDLGSLGHPPTGTALWRDVISALKHILANQTRQTNAALREDVPGFVAAVRAGDPLAERLSLTTRAFGSPSCDQT